MRACSDCSNPCAEQWRWQCRYIGAADLRPCETRDRRTTRVLKVAVTILSILTLGSAMTALHYAMA